VKKLIFVFVFLFMPSAFGERAAHFKGAVRIEQLITERITGVDHPFSLYRYFGASGRSALLLKQLLGAYVSDGTSSVFQNGEPNSVNMLLWNLVLYGLAEELEKNCSSSTSLPIRPPFRQSLDEICKWPQPSAKSEAVMRNFWLSLMSYDAPPDEFDAWKNLFLTSSYQNKPAGQTVSAMVFAALYNPHFLLRK
jgi:hypothetical protein